MKDLNYEYDLYIPNKFMIGITNSSECVGFPSMKNFDGKWTNVGAFEKICGFKPWTQRSEEKEITKALNQATDEIDNIPVDGFTIVNINKNAYDHFTTIFDSYVCAMLRDPRGWTITVKTADLQRILEAAHFNVVDGKISDIKLMYAWNVHNSCFTLVVADEHALDVKKATNRLFTKKNNVKYVKPSEFEVGKVYSSYNSKLAGHKYMYMGIHDIYSCELHENAFSTGRYDIDKFLNDRYDATSKDMHVFYCVDFKKEDLQTYDGLGRGAGSQPYFATKNVSKMFENVSDRVEGNFMMHNSSFPVTHETVVDNMSKSAMFNLIDLNSRHLVDFNLSVFEDLFGDMRYNSAEYYECRLKTYPFVPSCARIIMHCDSHGYEEPAKPFGLFNISNKTVNKTFTSFCISTGYNEDKYEVCMPRNDKNSYYGNFRVYFSRSFTQVNRKEVLRSLYDELKPKIFQYKFMNGNDVPMHQCASLNDSSIMQ